jgi:hypothetical protein
MPLVNPLLFYPWRAADSIRRGMQWGLLAARLARLRRRALRSAGLSPVPSDTGPTETVEASGIMETFAGKIPNTYGAPSRQVAS